MSSIAQPPYGSQEYIKFQNDYDGSSPARISTWNINSQEEALDCFVRISLRMRFYTDKIDELEHMEMAQASQEDKKLTSRKISSAKEGLSAAIGQGAGLMRNTKKYLEYQNFPIPSRLDPIISEYLAFP